MLDIKFIRENREKVEDSLRKRGAGEKLDTLLALDKKRREILTGVESLKHQRNKASDEIASLKREGKEAEDKIAFLKKMSSEIKDLDDEVKEIDEKIKKELLLLPNIVHETVPVGKDVTDNELIREWGNKRKFGFDPLPHWEIGENLKILDFKRGAKIAKTRFTVLFKDAALLERALINFMLDLHTQKHGYSEVFPPVLVSEESMTGTGQLPKFKQEVFQCGDDFGLYLIPTAEVPATSQS